MTYLSRRLWYVDKNGQHWLDQNDLIARAEPVIVLGEPGMGKTELLKTIADGDKNAFCRANQLINRGRPETLMGNAARLVIDALDEVAAQRQGDAVDLVLQKLGQLDYPPFVLSCRVADWRSAIASSAIAEQYEIAPLEVHLEALTPEEQLQLLSELTADAGRAKRLRGHFEAFGPDFLGNPQTIELIAALPINSLPNTTTALFEQAIETLRQERNPLKGELSRDVTLDAAGAAFAGLIISGNARIVDKPGGLIDQGDKALALTEVEAFDHGNVSRAVDTKLFAADRSEGFTYAHRRVGEFVGARWLAARANSRSKRRRLLEHFSSNGLVPASLRGLHAWLARDPQLAADVITADPMGVIEYGDAEALTTDQTRQLFAALERLAAENPRFVDWREYRASSLVSPPLLPEVERIVRNPNAEFGLRVLLLQQIRGASVAEQFRDLLRQLMLSEVEPYGIRLSCGKALLSLKGEEWPPLLEHLRCQARDDSLRLAHELVVDVGVGSFSDEQIVAIMLARDGLTLCSICAEPERTTVISSYRFAKRIPVARLSGLLDLFAIYAAALLPEHSGYEHNYLLDRIYALVLKRIKDGGPVDPLQLWRWLSSFKDQNSYHGELGQELAEWFKLNTAPRQAIQRYVLLDEVSEKDIWQRAWRLNHHRIDLYLTQDDVVALLGSMDPTDLRWREVLELGRTWGEEGRPLRNAAVRFAAGQSQHLKWIEAKANRPVSEWEHKRNKQTRKREAVRAARHAEDRRQFLEKIESVTAGTYGLVLAPAQAYLKRFHDIGDGVPAHERVAEWLGEELADAAHDGFEALLQARPPHPRAADLVRSYAASKRWPAGDIIVAAIAERLRTQKQPFDGLSSERLAAGLFECWHGAIDDHAGLKELEPRLELELKRRGKWRRVVRLFIEPQLHRQAKHVDHLWAIMRADDGGLGSDLAEEWLTRFPDLPAEAEVEMIDRLIRANRRDALRVLLADRRGRVLDDERRRNWDAIGLIVDFDTVRMRLERRIEPELLWNLRARIGGRRYDGEGLPAFLSVNQLAWIIETFRTVWPNVRSPESATVGDANPWDASDYLWSLIKRLGNDVSFEGATALTKLRDAPTDNYTIALRVVESEQRQKRADESYTPPTLDQIKMALNGGVPGSVLDLRVIVVDELQQLNRRLRGSSEDEVRWFWCANQPRSENECRDLTVSLLRGFLDPYSIFPMDEADMPQGKRADIVFYNHGLWLPVEAKRQQHPELWTAIQNQLEHLYTGHWQAEGQGVFLVFWFGVDISVPARPNGAPKPTTAAELQATLDSHPAAKAGRVKVVVLDLSKSA